MPIAWAGFYPFLEEFDGRIVLQVLLCAASVFSDVSLVVVSLIIVIHRDTENTEVARRKPLGVTAH